MEEIKKSLVATKITTQSIEDLILTIRGQQVMLDRDLAMLYGVETKRMNEQVRRNIERFPERFRFQLTKAEFEAVANCDRLLTIKYLSSIPYVFTEQGVAMLATVLHSESAVRTSICIMDAFVSMHRFLESNMQMFRRMETLEHRQFSLEKHLEAHDNQIDQVFNLLAKDDLTQKQGIFFDGEIFTAYNFVCDKIREAKKRIVLIDNYLDDSVLMMLTKRAESVSATAYTYKITPRLQQDIDKHNSQYPAVEVKIIKNVHDRFLMIDETVYHIGATIKDLGKKVFAFSRLEYITATKLLEQLVK